VKDTGQLSTGTQSGRVVMIVVIILVVVVGAAAGWWFLLRPTPTQAVQEFLKAADDMDEEKLQSLVTEETLQLARELEEQMRAQFGGMEMPAGAGPGVISGMAMGLTYGIEGVGEATVKGITATVELK